MYETVGPTPSIIKVLSAAQLKYMSHCRVDSRVEKFFLTNKTALSRIWQNRG